VLTKALEVLIDGEHYGIFVPQRDAKFGAFVGNNPETYMRAYILCADEEETSSWQLPDIEQGQVISFRMVDAESGSGVPPHEIRKRRD
jgi:hypothetical protein